MKERLNHSKRMQRGEKGMEGTKEKMEKWKERVHGGFDIEGGGGGEGGGGELEEVEVEEV